jgi:pentatricopeptide repeat protein
MVESGLKLDQFTYKALIHGFCKGKQLGEAKEALFEMMGAG